MRDSKEFKAQAQKMRDQGMEFTHEMYVRMKQAQAAKQQKERVIREEQDPEIQEAFNKVDIDRLFHEFNKRPMRQTPDEMAEDFMQMEHERKMSKRDKARAKFVKQFKLK